MGLNVVALPMGWFEVDRASLLYGLGYGTTMRIPVWSGAILGADLKILVDTGLWDPTWVTEVTGIKCGVNAGEGLEEGLKAIGWSPDEVDLVINTHMHFDHIGGNRFLSKASFLVQEAEWHHAQNPLKMQAWSYCDTGAVAADFFRWRLLRGPVDVVPGVRVMPTVGHTPGHQSIFVDTNEGCVAVTGDAVNMMDNIRHDTPPTIMTDVAGALDSVRFIAKVAQFVLPGHEPNVAPFSTDQQLPIVSSPD